MHLSHDVLIVVMGQFNCDMSLRCSLLEFVIRDRCAIITAGETTIGSRGLDMYVRRRGMPPSCHLMSLLQKQFVIVRLNH